VLRITESNRLETLADGLIAELGRPIGRPLTPDVVVVQNAGMARWLALRIARGLGLCAGITFPFPAAFVWDVFDRTLGTSEPRSAFGPDVLPWRILAELARAGDEGRFASLAAYAAGDDRRRYELARRLADVFDQYLVYRPDWIRRWEAGEDDGWQAELWRRVAAGAGGARHRVHRLDAFVRAVDEGRIEPAALPARVAVFGIPALPPAYLEVLARLGELTDVHLLLANPSSGYWFDLVSEREIARRVGLDPTTDRAAVAARHYETGPALLVSLGKQGAEFLELVHDRVGGQVDATFTPPAETSVLGRLQADIVAMRRPAPAALPATDRSIQLHACHGVLREVEVLHDQLLALFDAHPDLTPADVVVMTPDIEAYAPSIEAVFATVPLPRRIPFTIADRSARAESPIARAFLGLLALPASRYEASRLLALLDVDAVRRRFGFSEADLDLARAWVRDAGIRWGVDAAARGALGLPETHEHSWRFGLDRLLLGVARRGDDGRLVAGILPFDDVEGTAARVAGRLASFAEAAFALREELAGRRTVAAWTETLGRMFDRFIAPADAEEADAQVVRTAIASLADATADAGFAEPVSLGVVEADVRRALEAPTAAGRFLAGGVTFCAMVPMRSIPFEVVCLIGLDDGVFPRLHRPPGFDRMADDYRAGDRSRRDDDRWLFLEAILAARRALYVSWVGQDVRDNTSRPPSALVAELRDVLERDYDVPHETLITRHPLQAFSPRYFTGDARLPSYADELASAIATARTAPTRSARFFGDRLADAGPEWRRITVDQLVAFFRNPARFLLRERLGLRLEEGEGLIEPREPLLLEALDAYRLRDELLTLRHAGCPEGDAIAVARAAGLLPHARVGDIEAAAEASGVAALARRVERAAAGTPIGPVMVDLDLGAVELAGALDGVTTAGLLEYRPARGKKLKPGDETVTWVRHLVLNAVAPAGVEYVSRFIGQEVEMLLPPIPDAMARLAALGTLFHDGLHRPLPYLPRSAGRALRAKSDPLAAARREWLGDEDFPGEIVNPYLRLAFRGVDPIDDEFLRLAHLVLGSARAAATVTE
jgi:exodeoxyribonuclease V gamma subunit